METTSERKHVFKKSFEESRFEESRYEESKWLKKWKMTNCSGIYI